jgi:hypothetical protein
VLCGTHHVHANTTHLVPFCLTASVHLRSMNPDHHQRTASGSSSSSSQAQGCSADVELLVAKFNTNTPATTPEAFASKQKQAEAHRLDNNARDNVTGIRLSLRSAMAAVKPKTIAKMTTNAVLVWRKTSDQPSSIVSTTTRLSVESGNPAFGALVHEDDADQVNRNALWKIAKAIHSDDASDLFTHMGRCESAMRCQRHPEPEYRDSSNEAVQQVGKIYAMLQESIEASDIRSAVLVVSARFNSATIVRAILADNNANGVEWNSQQRSALEDACTNGHLETATLLACADGTQVSSMLNPSLALRYYCLAGDLERAQEILAEDSQDVAIGAALLDACRNGRCDIVAMLTADARFDSSSDGDEAFRVACVNGHVKVVSMLLLDLRLSIPIEEMMDGLDLAATAGHCDVVGVLVQHPRVNPGLDKSFALEQYCHAGDVKRVSELLDDPELDGGLPGAILAAASGNGRTAIVQLLLTDSRVDPSVDENNAIRLASARGHDNVVKLLLADPRADPAADSNYAIRYASSNGHAGVVKLLLADPRVDPAAYDNHAIRFASDNGHTSVVKLLLADTRVDPTAENNAAIRYASLNGHASVVKLLLAHPRVDPAAENNAAIQCASYYGRASVVTLLLADPRVDPAAENNNAIRDASSEGHASVVKLLLADPRVDPAANNNDAIRDASSNGHASVVELLLADPRVDPSAGSNYAIRNASSRGHASVVELLLVDLRVDPAAENNAAIQCASFNGRASVVELLLADPRVDPAADDNYAIRDASDNGHASVVELLLADPRVDPAADGNHAIRYASLYGHTSVVELLLVDLRVDPAADDNYAIRYASSNGHASVVELLLADPRVDPTADGNYAIRMASYYGRASVVELLLADPRADSSAENNFAIGFASLKGHAGVVKLLLAHPEIVATKAELMAADEGDHEDIVRMMFEKQPQVILDLFESATPCKPGGSLQSEVHQREKASALTLLLAVERHAGVLRVSDVLREVITEYACFDFVENIADESASTSSDDSYDSSDDGSGDSSNDGSGD